MTFVTRSHCNCRSSRRPATLVAILGSLALTTMVSSCSDGMSSEDSAIGVSALELFDAGTIEDVVSYADFVAVVVVTSSRRPNRGDIDSRSDASPTTEPSAEEYENGRILTYSVKEILWSSRRIDIPDSFEVVGLGTTGTGNNRRDLSPIDGVRAEVGDVFLAPFVESAQGRFALMEIGLQYPLVTPEADSVDLSAPVPEGPKEFVQLTLPELGIMLESTAPLAEVQPYRELAPMARRMAVLDEVVEQPPTSTDVPADSVLPEVVTSGP